MGFRNDELPKAVTLGAGVNLTGIDTRGIQDVKTPLSERFDCDRTVILSDLVETSKNIKVYDAHYNRLQLNVPQSAAVWLARFAFQACLLDRSSISPL